MADRPGPLDVIAGVIGEQKAVAIIRTLNEAGYAVVPIEATQEMVDEGLASIYDQEPALVWTDMMKAWLGDTDG